LVGGQAALAETKGELVARTHCRLVAAQAARQDLGPPAARLRDSPGVVVLVEELVVVDSSVDEVDDDVLVVEVSVDEVELVVDSSVEDVVLVVDSSVEEVDDVVVVVTTISVDVVDDEVVLVVGG
jgi:hypothetical protein